MITTVTYSRFAIPRHHATHVYIWVVTVCPLGMRNTYLKPASAKKYYKDTERPTEPKGAAGEPALGTLTLLFLPYCCVLPFCCEPVVLATPSTKLSGLYLLHSRHQPEWAWNFWTQIRKFPEERILSALAGIQCPPLIHSTVAKGQITSCKMPARDKFHDTKWGLWMGWQSTPGNLALESYPGLRGQLLEQSGTDSPIPTVI